jgi:hypothetical protein
MKATNDELLRHVGIAYNEADLYFDWLDRLAKGDWTADEVMARFQDYVRVIRRPDVARCPTCGLFSEHPERALEAAA